MADAKRTDILERKEALELFIKALAAKPDLLVGNRADSKEVAKVLIEGAEALLDFMKKPSSV